MSEKTELPTSKKIRESREKGDVAKSKDVTQTALIVSLFGYLIANSEEILKSFSEIILMPVTVLTMSFEDASEIVIASLCSRAIWIMLPLICIVISIGVLSEFLQTGVLFAFKVLPSAQKLNIANNLKKIFSLDNGIEFLKSVTKICLLGALIYFLLLNSLPDVILLPRGGLLGVGHNLGILLKTMLIFMAMAYFIIALGDLIWSRHRYVKRLMMSKDEVMREYKEMEGDPHFKNERKHLHKQLLQDGAVRQTRKASAVITNPTHIAVAILYKKNETPLPVVLAKGKGPLAARMIAAAREEGIPVMQNVPLARALIDSAELDQYIPSEFIEAVAEVLRLIEALPKN